MAEVGDLVQSFTMESGVKVRTFWVYGDIEVEGPLGESASADAFAAFVRFPANHDDEWGLFMLGVAIGPDFEKRLSTHREGMEAMWEKLVSGDSAAPDEEPFLLRRCIAFGTSLSRIAEDAVSQAGLQDVAYASITKVQRDLLTQLPVEVVRSMRDTFRTGGRGA